MKKGLISVFIFVILFGILVHSFVTNADDGGNGPGVSANAGVGTDSGNANATINAEIGTDSGNANATVNSEQQDSREHQVEVENNGVNTSIRVREGQDAGDIQEALQAQNRLSVGNAPDGCKETGDVIKCNVGGQMQVAVQVSSENVNLSAATQQTLDDLKSNLQNGTNEVQININVENGHTPEVEIEGGITNNQRTLLNTFVNETVSDIEAAGSNAHIQIEIKSRFVVQKAMAVIAGNSGNVILQVRGVNASTQVQLYKSNGSVYAILGNNTTTLISYFPDDVQKLILQRTNASLNNTNITLDSSGQYKVQAEKQARFLGLFKVQEHVSWHVDAQTGNVSNENAPWWGFLASNIQATNNGQLLGSSCATVTPGQNDACCQTKGYDYWNSSSQECEYNVSG